MIRYPYGYNYSFGYGGSAGVSTRPLISYAGWNTTTPLEYVTDGVELIPSSNYTTGSGWVNNNGVLTVNTGSYTASYISGNITLINALCIYTVRVTNYVSGSFKIIAKGTDSSEISSDGTFELPIAIGSTGSLAYIQSQGSGFVGTIEIQSIEKVIQEPNVRYLDNIGTSKAINDAEMFSGRVISFSSASSQYIDFNHLEAPLSNTDMCFFCTFNWTGGSDDRVHDVIDDIGSVGSRHFLYEIEGGDLRLYNGAWQTISTITYGETYSLLGLYDDLTNEVISYLNGNEVARTPVDYIFGFNKDGRTIGAKWDNVGQFFNGDISNIGFINQSLTPTQIKKLHTTPETFIKRVGNDIYLDGVLNTNVVSWVAGTMLAQYEYDLATNTQLEITNFTTSCRDNQNENKGYQSAKATKDSLGMITGLSEYVEHDNISYANNNWDGSGAWQLERVDNLNGTLTHFVYDSNGNKFTNGVADGTYTIPTLPKNMFDGNTFDGVSTVTQTRLNDLYEGLEKVPLELYNNAILKGLFGDVVYDNGVPVIDNGVYVFDNNI